MKHKGEVTVNERMQRIDEESEDNHHSLNWRNSERETSEATGEAEERADEAVDEEE